MIQVNWTREAEIWLKEIHDYIARDRPEAATGVVFRETEGDYDYDFHNAPRRQYVINLDAAVEIEIGDGSKRVLGPGEILLAEDTTGRGHRSRAVDGKARRSIFITLD